MPKGIGLVGANGTNAFVQTLLGKLVEEEARRRAYNAQDFNQGLAARRIANEETQTAEGMREFNSMLPIHQQTANTGTGNLQLGRDELNFRNRAATAQQQSAQQQITNLQKLIDDPTTPEPTRALGRAQLAGLKVNSVNDLGMAPEKPPQRSLQAKSVLVNGKQTMANFDPSSGKWFDQQGNDVSGSVQDVPPQRDPIAQELAQERLDRLRNPPPRPATGEQKSALGFYNRAQSAIDDASQFEGKIAHAGLLDQAKLQFLPNFLQSEQAQKYRNAQRAFSEAKLRKESGAAISQSEYETDAKVYFAQPGDTPETIKQKQALRQEVLDGLAFAAGPAYEEFYGQKFERKGNAVNPGGDKSVTMAELQAVAKKNGTTVEQEKARATAEGYVIR